MLLYLLYNYNKRGILNDNNKYYYNYSFYIYINIYMIIQLNIIN